MKTRVVHLKTGGDVTLYFIESVSRWTASRQEYDEHVTNFEMFTEGNIDCSLKMHHTIMRFFEETSEINKETIKRMINTSMKNVQNVYEMILTTFENRKGVRHGFTHN